MWPCINNDLLYDGFEHMGGGSKAKAKKCFEKVLSVFPNHIDALCAMSSLEKDRLKSLAYLNKALNIGKKAIPEGFDMKKDRIEWIFLENRAFLRAYHTYGLFLLNENQTEKAVKVFEQMLIWNPNDNQGVRDILADIYIQLEDWRKMLWLGNKYKGDSSPSISYAWALILFMTKRREEADKALFEAIKFLPLCAKELIKKTHKKPKTDMPGHIAFGGEDQAYEFWETQGQFKAWQDEEVQKWIGNMVEKVHEKKI
ncbi:MAG: hypothetical protein V1859_01550 [archaeon]